MDLDLDEEGMDDVIINDEREHHWRMFFKDNYGGVDSKKAILHAKRWDVYMNNKLYLIKCGYSV